MPVLFVMSFPEESVKSSPTSLSWEEEKEKRADVKNDPSGKGQTADLRIILPQQIKL